MNLKSDRGNKTEINNLASQTKTVFMRLSSFATFRLQVTKGNKLKIRFVTEETNRVICTYAKIAQVTKIYDFKLFFFSLKNL